MTKIHALKLLGMLFPQDKPSKLNHCLTEIQVTNMLKGALEPLTTFDILNEVLRFRVLQVVQNRKEPITLYQWCKQYALIMQDRIGGECNFSYCWDSACASEDSMGTAEWMVTTPAEAVQAEMECWDE